METTMNAARGTQWLALVTQSGELQVGSRDLIATFVDLEGDTDSILTDRSAHFPIWQSSYNQMALSRPSPASRMIS
jgi:hypothetical protein